MTVAPVATDAASIGVNHRGLRLWAPIVAHSTTDFFSFVTIALLPLLAVRLGMSIEQKAWLLGLGAAASGLVQPIVAWVSDHTDSRLPGPIGLAVAATAVGLLGYVESFAALTGLFFIAVLGIGTFHPVSAAAVGQLAGTRRSAMVGVFFLFGMVGGIAGNVLSPLFVRFAGSLHGRTGEAATTAGLHALVVFIPMGLAAAIYLAWAIRRVPHRHHEAADRHQNLSHRERRKRWAAVWLLYAGNIIRFTVNQMLVYLVIEWAERLVRVRHGVGALDDVLGQRASELNGPIQASMQVGMGLGALGLGFFLKSRHEKAAFVLVPLLGVAAIALLPMSDRLGDAWGIGAVVAGAVLLGIAAGVGFGSLVPVSISLGQRLLPHRTSLVSGLLMGGSWCVAFIGPQIARAIHRGVDGNLEKGFGVAAGLLLLASVMGAALPGRLIRETSPH